VCFAEKNSLIILGRPVIPADAIFGVRTSGKARGGSVLTEIFNKCLWSGVCQVGKELCPELMLLV